MRTRGKNEGLQMWKERTGEHRAEGTIKDKVELCGSRLADRCPSSVALPGGDAMLVSAPLSWTSPLMRWNSGNKFEPIGCVEFQN